MLQSPLTNAAYASLAPAALYVMSHAAVYADERRRERAYSSSTLKKSCKHYSPREKMTMNDNGSQRGRMTQDTVEQRRLQNVRNTGLLDTGPEQAYDDLVQLAACICQVPMSLVTLVDEHRLWLKAKVGVPISEVPRDFSFCSYTIQQDDLFVIPDTLEDARYSANAAVTSNPYVRFYAGYPLSTSSGEKIGSLCVLDSEPRNLSEQQQVAMRVLGRQVSVQIELKQQLQALHDAIQQKQIAELELQASQRQLETANEVLLQQSLTDPLTSLNNRRCFDYSLASAFYRSRPTNTPFSLLMLDVDHFKTFNDNYGHLQGDCVLRRVGSLVRAGSRVKGHTRTLRGRRIFGHSSRHGWRGRRCRSPRVYVVQCPNETWDLRPITVSIGVATVDAGMLTAHELVDAADQALYQAKADGKNCVRAFRQNANICS